MRGTCMRGRGCRACGTWARTSPKWRVAADVPYDSHAQQSATAIHIPWSVMWLIKWTHLHSRRSQKMTFPSMPPVTMRPMRQSSTAQMTVLVCPGRW